MTLKMMTLKMIVIAVAAVAWGAAAAWADEVTVSGCAETGIEAGCIMLKADGKLYNITAAVPKPKIGEYGTVQGTPADAVTICMQGTVLSPATWTADTGKSCGQ
jgi:hypothetical protein